MTEVERYSALLQEKEALNERCVRSCVCVCTCACAYVCCWGSYCQHPCNTRADIYTHATAHILHDQHTHTHTTHTQLCSWDEQNALLVESHERVIGELTEDYEVI